MKILITTKAEGPPGWDVISWDDTNIFFEPGVEDEPGFYEMVDEFKNGNVDRLLKVAEVDNS